VRSPNRNAIIVIVAGIMFLTGLSLSAYLVLGIWWRPPASDIESPFAEPPPFSESAWASAAADARTAMARDLASGERLKHRSRGEVIDLLGKPNTVARRWCYALQGESELSVFFDDNWAVHRIGGSKFPQAELPQPMLFDAEGWKSGTELQRLRMAITLSGSASLTGKPRSQVADLLGNPAAKYNSIFYDLGPSDRGPTATYTLCIEFDEDDIYVRSYIGESS